MSSLSSHVRARLMFDPAEQAYDFGSQHPLQPRRLEALRDLLETSSLWSPTDGQTQLHGRVATLEELHLVHTPDYIAAVQHLSRSDEHGMTDDERREQARLALHYGFGDGDTPAFPQMHDLAARIVGGTLVALSAVMGLPEGSTFTAEDERPLHVFHPAGGWHHAWQERASGFCIYNDIAVAIAHVLSASEAKVLYLDFDAHHGDGVQRAFYDDSRVMTVSFHETGRYLFPGTGDVLELGSGAGRGYSVNVPLEAFTEDDSYIETMDALLAPLVASFAPDVILSMHGCDVHAWDPLTHLRLTMRGIFAQAKAVHELAHTYCGGRWVALGGGGYDPYRVVPRAWSMLWAEMSEQSIPESLPKAWIARWRPVWEATEAQEEAAQQVMGKAPLEAYFPVLFQDRAEDFLAQPRREPISTTNRRTVALVRHLLIPPTVRHAFPVPRQHSPFIDMFDLLHGNRSGTPSRTKVMETKQGTLLLRDFSPPSLIKRLRAESGLRAFARLPEREHQLLLDIASSPDCALTIAHTPAGEIVGQVTLAPLDDWWEGVENAYEIAIEVSSHWRGVGLARQMLAFALELEAVEDIILVAEGLSWHWDLEGLDISVLQYRKVLAHLFASQGFEEYDTTEPNISMERGNILLVRIGKRVDKRIADQFREYVMHAPNLVRE